MLILFLSISIGHFLPPTGILVIPIVLLLMVVLIVFTDNSFNIFEKSIISYLCIGLNDLGIKLFAGGIHDLEGIGWIHMSLFIGLIPCTIVLLFGVVRDKNANIWLKILSIVMFVFLIYSHLEIFETIGVVVQ